VDLHLIHITSGVAVDTVIPKTRFDYW